MYTMILSGPAQAEGQVREALNQNRAGLVVHEQTVGHGLPEAVDGSADPNVSFVSVEGEDIDVAYEAAVVAGWGLRAHYHTPTAASPLLVDPASDQRVREIFREEMAKMGQA